MKSFLSRWLWLAIAFGCVSACSSNHAPVFVPIGNKAVQTGQTLEFTVRAVDDDKDKLELKASNLPNGASFTPLGDTGVFNWTPLASDAGESGEGKDYSVSFMVNDGSASTSELVIISVSLGNAGEGSPVFITPSDYTLDLNKADEIRFNIQVRDPDSNQVNLSLGREIPGGDFQTAAGSKLASFRWKPTTEQFAEQPVWSMRVEASDEKNPAVIQDITILLRGGDKKCPGTPPSLSHVELADQRGADDYPVSVQASDEESSVVGVVLYFQVEDADSDDGRLQKVPMTQVGGSWQAAIPNPGLTGEASARVSYTVCAQDDDDPDGADCDHRACLPEEGRFSFTAYAPGNSTCQNDAFDVQAPNDSYTQASEVEKGIYGDLRICPDEEDWYRLDVKASHVMMAGIAFNESNGQLQLDLLDADGATVLTAGQAGPGEMTVIPGADMFAQARSVYLRIRGAEGVNNSYNLLIIDEPYQACEPDNLEGAGNNRPEDAVLLSEDDYPDLSVCGQDDSDWYKVDLQEGDKLEVLIEFTHWQMVDNLPVEMDLDVLIFDPAEVFQENLSYYHAMTSGTSRTDNELAILHKVPVDNTYYIQVAPVIHSPEHLFKNQYDMTVVVTRPDCIDDENEQNDDPEEATHLFVVGDSLQVDNLQICPDDEDWFKIDLNAGDTVEISATFSHVQGDIDLLLYDPGVLQDFIDYGESRLNEHVQAGGVSSDDNELFEFTAPEPGQYFLQVQALESASNSYDLALSFQ